MKTWVIFLLIGSLFYLPGCKKQEDTVTVIKGSLIYNNLKLLDNLNIRLMVDSTNGVRFDPYSDRFIKKLITVDQNCKFNDRITGLNATNNYYLLLFNDTMISDVYPVFVNKENNIDIIGEPLSHLRLIVKNDSLKYREILITTLSDMRLNNSFMIEGQINDSVIIIPTVQNATCRIFWDLYVDDYPKYRRSEFIHIEQRDTLDYRIIY